MKLIIGILLALLANTVQVYAQQPFPRISLSEIRQDIKDLESPEEKLRTYVELSTRYLRNSPDSLLVLARDISELEGISDQQKEAFSSFLNANAYRLLNADSSAHYAGIAAENLKDLEEHDSYLTMENLRATQYIRNEQYLEAESLFLNAIDYREEIEEEARYPVHFLYGNLGNLYVNVEAHDLAIEMYEKFLEYENNPGSRCNILSKLATSFLKLDSYDKALEVLSPCIEIQNLPPPIKSIVSGNLSSIYEAKGDTGTATQLLEEAVKISRTNQIPNISGTQAVRLGNLYLNQGLITDADSVKGLISLPATSYSRPNEDIMKLHFFSRLAVEKQSYEDAIQYANEAIEIGEKHDLTQLLGDIYSIKATAFEGLGQVEEALMNERKQLELDDSISRLREEWSDNMLSVRYQLKNKEAQLVNANLELESVRVRNLFIFITVILLASYIFYRYRLHYLLKEEKTRNQIARDLHDDLSGTLSSISFFSEAAKRVQGDPTESKRFLNIIDESASEAKEKINDIIWAIDPKNDDWKSFLKKCKRFASDMLDSHDIEHTLDFSEDLDFPLTLKIRQNIWLIFKECITNLTKHSQAKNTIIKFKKQGDRLLLEIIDDGIGFTANETEEGHGLKNIKYRAEAIGGKVQLETAKGNGTAWRFAFNL